MQTELSSRIRLCAVSLAISAFLFAAFPIIRPFGDRSAIPSQVAETFISTPWVLSHILAIIAFVLLPVGLFGLYSFLQKNHAERISFLGLILGWIGAGLFIPILGTEAFALRAIGQTVVQQKNLALLTLADSIRMGPERAFVIVGLTILAIGSIMFAIAIWKNGSLPKLSGIVFAIGLSLFFPLLPQVVRIVDGLLIGIGGIWIAWSILRRKHSAS